MPISLKYQKTILLFVILFTGIQCYFLSQLQFDYDIEQLFPKHDPELQFHQEVEDKFKFHQDYLILGIENNHSIFKGDFLLRLDSLTKKLATHHLVKEINAVTNLRYHLWTPFGIKDLPFTHPKDSSRHQQDAIFLRSYSDVAPKFISKKNTAVCSYVFLTQALTEDTKDEMRSFIDQNTTELGFNKPYIYGDIYAQDSYIKELESEMYWLSCLSLLIILSMLFIGFRSLWGVFIPIVIVIMTTIWTMGTLAMFGVAINMMTVLIPTIVAIISLSDVIHFINRFQEFPLHNKQNALKKTLKDMHKVILLTSITTGLGFITLSYSNIQPFIEFGIFTTIGVTYAYLLAVWLLPILLDLMPLITEKQSQQPNFLIPTFYRFVDKNPKAILILMGLILLFSLSGISKLRINSFLYEELSSKDTFSETLRFFENHFSGIRTFTLHLSVTDTSKTIVDYEVLHQIEQLETYLLEDYGLNDIYTISTQLKRANRVAKKGRPDAFVLPQDTTFLKYITDKTLSKRQETGLQSILTEDNKESKITGKIEDLGSAEIRKRNQKLTKFISSELDTSLIKTQLTGSTLLLDKSNEIITYKLLYGLLFAIIVVAILMGMLYGSMKIMFIATIPNILPLIMILGVIGWTDMGLKMSTVIIFTIAFGIAVDDSIHFLNRLKTELKKGHPLHKAIELTYLSTGKAIVTTSIILILGFGVLLFSSFQTTFITGLLVSLALLFALIADLILLPVLLKMFYKDEQV